MKNIAILFLFCFFNHISFTQERTVIDPDVVDAISSIRESVCNKDTLKAIKLLEEFRVLYPNNGMIVVTNKILGDYYISLNQNEKAIELLRYVLTNQPSNRMFRMSRESDCDKYFNRLVPSQSRADVCTSLSDAFIGLEQYDSSLHYLNLAETKYMPYSGCVNGMIMYYSRISPAYAETYLLMGDTTKAINRLLDYFLKSDGDMVAATKKLKEILLLKYSPSEIKSEIERGINQLKIVENAERKYPARLLEFELFEYTIQRNAYDYPVDHFQALYNRHESIRSLKQF